MGHLAAAGSSAGSSDSSPDIGAWMVVAPAGSSGQVPA